MDGHVKVVGALQIVWGSLFLVGALVLLLVGDFAAQAIREEGNEEEAARFTKALLGTLGFALLVYALLGIVGAIGLFGLKGWGRGLSLAFCGIALIQIPFGTALGVYGLVILTRPETADLFRGQAWRPA